MLIVAFLIHLLHSYYPKTAQATLVQTGLSKRQASSSEIYPYWLVRISRVWDWKYLGTNGTGGPFSITCTGPDDKDEEVLFNRLVLILQQTRFKNRTLVIADIGADASGRPCKCHPLRSSTDPTGSCGHPRTMVPSVIERGVKVTGNACVRPRNFTYYVPVSTCDDIGRYVCQATAPYNNKMVVVEDYRNMDLDRGLDRQKVLFRAYRPPAVGSRFAIQCFAWFPVSNGIHDQFWKWEYVNSSGGVDVASFDTKTHNFTVSNSLRVNGLCYLHQMTQLIIDPVTTSLIGKRVRCVFDPTGRDPRSFPCCENPKDVSCCRSYSFGYLNDTRGYPKGSLGGHRESVGLNAGVVAGIVVGVLVLVAAVVGGILYSRGKIPMVSRKVKAEEHRESPEVVHRTSLAEAPNQANADQPETDQAVTSHALQVKVNEDRHGDADTDNEENL